MANSAMVYTTASRTRRKGEVHRGGCGCDARTVFPRSNDGVAARCDRVRWVKGAEDVAAVSKSSAVTRRARRGLGSEAAGSVRAWRSWRPAAVGVNPVEMLSKVVQHPPDVVVYKAGPESVSDLTVLRLLRRVAQLLLFVLVAARAAILG